MVEKLFQMNLWNYWYDIVLTRSFNRIFMPFFKTSVREVQSFQRLVRIAVYLLLSVAVIRQVYSIIISINRFSCKRFPSPRSWIRKTHARARTHIKSRTAYLYRLKPNGNYMSHLLLQKKKKKIRFLFMGFL
jgi:hypothetical protein